MTNEKNVTFDVKKEYRITYINKRGMKSVAVYHAATEAEARDRFLSNPKNRKCVLISVFAA